MHPLFWLGFVSFIISLFLTPIFRDLFRSYGFVDKPDQGRKTHRYPIPRVGGVAIAFSYVAALLIVQFRMHMLTDAELTLVWKILPAAAIIFVVGVIDDLFTLTSWQKLIGQFAGAAVAYSSGIRLLDVAGTHYEAWWTLPATILWLLVCTNAFNLVDGMDGLASGVGLFSTATIFIAALIDHNVPLAMATIPLSGCLLGFLCFNFNPATIFLGDSGSLLIGFLLGCFGIVWSHKSATLLGMTAPLIALSLPLIDVSLAIARRFLRRQPIFSPDRGHIHHRLLDRGLSPRKAALLLYGICSIVATISLLESRFQSVRYTGFFVLLFCAIAWVGIQYLGYAEFHVAGKMLFKGGLQQTLKAQLDLNAFDHSLRICRHSEECRERIDSFSSKFGLVLAELQLPGEYWFKHGVAADDPWTIHVPLGAGCYANFARAWTSESLPASIGPFVDIIRSAIEDRLPILEVVRAKATPVSILADGLAGPESAA